MSTQAMTSRSLNPSRSRTTQVLGHTTLNFPNNNGKSCFNLTTTTHSMDPASMRHFLTGLRQMEEWQWRRAELVTVMGEEVVGWSHAQVVCRLNDHLARVEEDDLTLMLKARDEQGRKHIVEVAITVIYEDGLGDHVRAAYDIIVRTVDKIVTTPDVTDVEFEKSYYIRIRHGAQTGLFLKEGSDHTMCMSVPPGDSDECIFKCYNFIGHNHEGEGGGDGGFPRLCVLQQPRSGRFVAACPTSGCLQTDEDAGFSTNIESITTPDCHFFIMHNSEDSGVDTFCLTPLVMRHYYLCYDAVKGLRLKKCVPPPYKNFLVVRFFSFQFLQAEYNAHGAHE